MNAELLILAAADNRCVGVNSAYHDLHSSPAYQSHSANDTSPGHERRHNARGRSTRHIQLATPVGKVDRFHFNHVAARCQHVRGDRSIASEFAIDEDVGVRDIALDRSRGVLAHLRVILGWNWSDRRRGWRDGWSDRWWHSR